MQGGYSKAGKIDKLRMLQMIKENQSLSYMARVFGCTVGAVSKMKDRLMKRMEENPELLKSEMSGASLDAMGQLAMINATIMQELRRCQTFIDREDGLFKELAKLEAMKKKDPHNLTLAAEIKDKSGLTYKQALAIQDNVLKIAAEIRHQLEFQLNIAQTLYSVQMMAEFQEEVIDVLREVSQEVHDKVIHKLKERRALRGLLKAP